MVKIISDDTDVFALASNYFPEEAMDVTMLMKPTKSGRTVTNIMVTVRKHELVMKSLLAARLSVCDTVCHYQWIVMKIVIKVFEKQPSLHKKWSFPLRISSFFVQCIDLSHSTMKEVISEACYRIQIEITMSDKT